VEFKKKAKMNKSDKNLQQTSFGELAIFISTVSKIRKYITDTKYCSDLGFNNCKVKKKKVKWFQIADSG
jgi:hypothetical protein